MLNVKEVHGQTHLAVIKIIDAANLRETSLYTLAQMVGIEDETAFVQCFIDYERQVKHK